MGSKKARSADVEAQATRLAAIRERNRRALLRHGIDVEAMERDTVAAIRAERGIKALTKTRDRMAKAVAGPTAPTHERVARAGVHPREIEVRPDQPRAHRFEWQLDLMRDSLTTRQYEAAERLRDCHMAMQPRSTVSDYSGASGSSDPSKRLAVTETQELAARNFHWIMGRLDGLHERVIRHFVLEQPDPTTEQVPTAEEFGRKLGKRRESSRAKGIAEGAIILACARLAQLWHAYDAEQLERCQKTDRLMRSDIGRRAAREGWICALHDFARAKGRLPETIGDLDQIRKRHDEDARERRNLPISAVERWNRRRDRLTGIAFRDDEQERVRAA